MAEYRHSPPPERREVIERHEVVERSDAPGPPAAAPRSGGFDWIWVVLLVLVALGLVWFVFSRGQPLRWGDGGNLEVEIPRVEVPRVEPPQVERRIEIAVPQAPPAPTQEEPREPPQPPQP